MVVRVLVFYLLEPRIDAEKSGTLEFQLALTKKALKKSLLSLCKGQGKGSLAKQKTLGQ